MVSGYDAVAGSFSESRRRLSNQFQIAPRPEPTPSRQPSTPSRPSVPQFGNDPRTTQLQEENRQLASLADGLIGEIENIRGTQMLEEFVAAERENIGMRDELASAENFIAYLEGQRDQRNYVEERQEALDPRDLFPGPIPPLPEIPIGPVAKFLGLTLPGRPAPDWGKTPGWSGNLGPILSMGAQIGKENPEIALQAGIAPQAVKERSAELEAQGLTRWQAGRQAIDELRGAYASINAGDLTRLAPSLLGTAVNIADPPGTGRGLDIVPNVGPSVSSLTLAETFTDPTIIAPVTAAERIGFKGLVGAGRFGRDVVQGFRQPATAAIPGVRAGEPIGAAIPDVSDGRPLTEELIQLRETLALVEAAPSNATTDELWWALTRRIEEAEQEQIMGVGADALPAATRVDPAAGTAFDPRDVTDVRQIPVPESPIRQRPGAGQVQLGREDIVDLSDPRIAVASEQPQWVHELAEGKPRGERVPYVTESGNTLFGRIGPRGEIVLAGIRDIREQLTFRGARVGEASSEAVLGGRRVNRGKEALIKRIQLERNVRGINQEAVDAAIEFIRSMPDDVLEGGALSFRNVDSFGAAGEGQIVAGFYNTNDSIANIALGAVNRSMDPNRIIIHEVSHHIERFLGNDAFRALQQQYRRELDDGGSLKLFWEELRTTSRREFREQLEREARERLTPDQYRRWKDGQNFPGVRRPPSPRAADPGLYRFTSFNEWFAEVLTDRALRDFYARKMPVGSRNAFLRAIDLLESFAIGIRNILLRNNRPDAAERVYQDLIAGNIRRVGRQRADQPRRPGLGTDSDSLLPPEGVRGARGNVRFNLAQDAGGAYAGRQATNPNPSRTVDASDLESGEVIYIDEQPFRVDRINGSLVDLDKIFPEGGVGAGPTIDLFNTTTFGKSIDRTGFMYDGTRPPPPNPFAAADAPSIRDILTPPARPDAPPGRPVQGGFEGVAGDVARPTAEQPGMAQASFIGETATEDAAIAAELARRGGQPSGAARPTPPDVTGGGLRYDPATDRYNGETLTRGDVLVDDAGDLFEVERVSGFTIEAQLLDESGERLGGQFTSFSLENYPGNQRFKNVRRTGRNFFSDTTPVRAGDDVAEAADKITIDLRGPERFSGDASAQDFIDEILELSDEVSLLTGRPIIDNVEIELVQGFNNQVSIASMRSLEPGKGAGTRVLKQITDLADKRNITLVGDAVPIEGAEGLMVNPDRLRRWYERAGYVFGEFHNPSRAIRRPRPDVTPVRAADEVADDVPVIERMSRIDDPFQKQLDDLQAEIDYAESIDDYARQAEAEAELDVLLRAGDDLEAQAIIRKEDEIAELQVEVNAAEDTALNIPASWRGKLFAGWSDDKVIAFARQYDYDPFLGNEWWTDLDPVIIRDFAPAPNSAFGTGTTRSALEAELAQARADLRELKGIPARKRPNQAPLTPGEPVTIVSSTLKTKTGRDRKGGSILLQKADGSKRSLTQDEWERFNAGEAVDDVPAPATPDAPVTPPVGAARRPIDGTTEQTDVFTGDEAVQVQKEATRKLREAEEAAARGDLPDTDLAEVTYQADVAEINAGGRPPVRPPDGPSPPSPPAPPPPEGSATKRVFDRISLEDGGLNIVERLRSGWHSFLRQMVDELHPLDEFVRAAEKGGLELSMEENPYLWARMLPGVGGKARVMIEEGTFGAKYWKQGPKGAVPNLRGPGLEEILKPVSKPEEWRDFAAYVTARRALDLNRRNIATGIPQKDAGQAVRELEAKYPEFKRTAAAVYKYQNELLDYGEEMGLLAPDLVAKLKKTKDYVPFLRVFDELQAGGFMGKKYADVQSPIRRIKGSEREIVNPLESIVKNTYLIVDAADRNQVGRLMANMVARDPALEPLFKKVPQKQALVARTTAKELGISLEGLTEREAEQIFDIFRPSQYTGENIVTVMDKGKKTFYEVDPDLYRGLLSMDTESVGMAIKWLGLPARWLRAGATLSPDFMIKNPLRDQLTAYTYSRYGFIPGVDWVRGVGQVLGKTDEYTLWKLSGGERSTLVSMDRNYLNKSFQEIVDEHKMTDYVKSPLEYLQILSEFTEKGTRMGEFVRGIRRGASPMDAGYSSREVTLDFAKMGTSARTMNRLIAFFNANIRDWDRLITAFKTHPVKTSFKVFTGITLPSIALYYINRDNPRYQELPDYQKDLFWNIIPPNGPIVRIPKPFTLGILFGSVPERFLESLDKKDPEILKGVFGSALEMGTPGYVPTALLPAIETQANYSFFRGGPIVGRGREGFPDEMQYSGSTSEAAKLLGEGLNFSPAHIDNIISGYTAGLGNYVVQGIDKALEGTGITNTAPDPSRTAADYPVLKSFIARDPTGSSSKSVDDFYKAYEKSESVEKALKEFLQKGQETKFKNYLADHPEALFFYDNNLNDFFSKQARAYRVIAAQMSGIRTAQRDIYASRSLSPQEKRDKLDELNALMTTIAQRALMVDEVVEQQEDPPVDFSNFEDRSAESIRAVELTEALAPIKKAAIPLLAEYEENEPGKSRTRYRARHPEVDAHLFVIGRVSTTQSTAGKSLAREMIIEAGLLGMLEPDSALMKNYRKELGDRWVESNIELEPSSEVEPSIEVAPPPSSLPSGNVEQESLDEINRRKAEEFESPYDFGLDPASSLPEGDIPVAQNVNNTDRWEQVSAQLSGSDLRTLNSFWREGGDLLPEQEAKLRAIHEQFPFGQANFQTWLKQTLRQIQTNAANVAVQV